MSLLIASGLVTTTGIVQRSQEGYPIRSTAELGSNWLARDHAFQIVQVADGTEKPATYAYSIGGKWLSVYTQAVISTDPLPAWDGSPRNLLTAELGDSFIENGQITDTSQGQRIYGYVGAAVNLAGGRVRRMGKPGQFGNGGDSTPMAGVRLPDAIASGAGLIIANVSTNDEDKGLSVDATLNELKRWKAECYAARVVMIINTPAPRGNDATPGARLTGDALARMMQRRERMLAELPGPGFHVVDTRDAVLKPGTVWDIRDEYSDDAKHPNPVGAYEGWGPLVAAKIKAIFPAPKWLPNGTTARSKNANVEMAGPDGQIPTGYVGANATGTTAVTRTYGQTSNDRGRWAFCTLGGGAATANAAVDLFQLRNLHTGLVTGKVYILVCEFEIDAGVTGLLSVQLGLQAFGSSTIQLWDNNRYSTDPMSSKEQRPWMVTPPFTMVDGLTDLRGRATAYMATTGVPVANVRARNFELVDVADLISTLG